MNSSTCVVRRMLLLLKRFDRERSFCFGEETAKQNVSCCVNVVVVRIGLHVACILCFVSILAHSLVHSCIHSFTHAPTHFDVVVDDDNDDADEDGNRTCALVGVGETG